MNFYIYKYILMSSMLSISTLLISMQQVPVSLKNLCIYALTKESAITNLQNLPDTVRYAALKRIGNFHDLTSNAIPLVLLMHTMRSCQEQERQPQEKLAQLTLHLARNANIQLNRQQTDQLVHHSHFLDDLNKDLPQEAEYSISLEMLDNEQQLTTLFSYIDALDGLSNLESKLEAVRQKVPVLCYASAQDIQEAYRQDLVRRLQGQTIADLCALVTTASFLGIHNQGVSVSFIDLVNVALTLKLIEKEPSQEDQRRVCSLPIYIQQEIARLFLEKSGLHSLLHEDYNNDRNNIPHIQLEKYQDTSSLSKCKYLTDSPNKDTQVVWHEESNRYYSMPTTYKKYNSYLRWSPNGRCLASINNTDVRVWDKETKQYIYVLQGQHQAPVSAISWSPNGKYLVSNSSADGTIVIWNSNTGNSLYNLSYTYNAAQPVLISWAPDNETVALYKRHANTYHIAVLNVETDAYISIKPRYELKSISWSPNGRYLAASSNNGNISIWNTKESGNLLYGWQEYGNPAGSVSWSSDGKYLIYYCNDDTILVYPWIDATFDNNMHKKLTLEFLLSTIYPPNKPQDALFLIIQALRSHIIK